MRSNDGDGSSWQALFELLSDLSDAPDLQSGLEELTSQIEEVVPADRGVSLMRMDGLIPYCVRWPSYAERLIPRFNEYYNTHSPMYYRPPYRVLPPVDWADYDSSDYHNEFNRPLGIRYSLGLGFRDEWRDVQYAAFVHRSAHGPAFAAADRAVFATLCKPLSNIVSLLSRGDGGFAAAVQPREADPRCKILSPREAEVADLICRRFTMREIGLQLGISRRTVERHALHIYQKLNIDGRAELIRLRCR